MEQIQAESTLNFILIRYADVLLMYAEAKIELNEIDDSVYDAINAVGPVLLLICLLLLLANPRRN